MGSGDSTCQMQPSCLAMCRSCLFSFGNIKAGCGGSMAMMMVGCGAEVPVRDFHMCLMLPIILVVCKR